ncbi:MULTISPECIES: SDR family oxidoreductase [unclassified Exiguobacterium]|uniref:SDR family NAD(P)-dependent oxidoreductase n=1 Tax=unclassified Exiguobacterium TaxID=2644629 RepID=UPI000DF7C8B5|nr:SDR family oxidoreductase [Exiguobacterium sp. RIT594]RDB32213.1 SDR family NAD(P)-dependent oxidoreductase [Exiguobacterium sp. RIT594]
MQKTVLITGASGGIGKELADRFAQDGYNMVLVARNEAKILELATDYQMTHGVDVTVIAKDVATPGVPQEIFNELQQKKIHVDYLINNAGFGLYGAFLETDLEQEMNMIEVNIKAVTVMTKLFLPGMVQRNRGGVMNVSSMVGFFPGPLMSVYHATKSYVLSFTEALENEVSGTNVTVTALCPGLTATGFVDRAGMGKSNMLQGKVMEAGRVAEIGYRGFLKGQTLIIPGTQNRIISFIPRLLPRKRLTRMIRKMQDGSTT